jgi:WD40 repeat protein
LLHVQQGLQAIDIVYRSRRKRLSQSLFSPLFFLNLLHLQTVKLWDLETGKDIFEYNNAHDDSAITCMTFDETNRRLVTAGRDGTCKLWNFNNGHCLKILHNGEGQEITDVKYTRIHNNKFIVCVGWDRKINIFDDDLNDVKFLLEPNPRWPDDIVSLCL